jgi:hypothetical protein
MWALVDGELVLGGEALEEIEEAGPKDEAEDSQAPSIEQFGPEWWGGKQ